MKPSVSPLFSAFVLALIAAAPLARAQDSSTPPAPAAPSGSGDQTSPPPPPPPHHRMRGPSAEELKAKLNLTDDQYTKVAAIISSTREQAKAIHEDDSLGDDDKRAKMMDLMKSTHDQIRALLTPDQQKIYDSMMPKRGPGGPPPGPPAGAPPPSSN